MKIKEKMKLQLKDGLYVILLEFNPGELQLLLTNVPNDLNSGYLVRGNKEKIFKKARELFNNDDKVVIDTLREINL